MAPASILLYDIPTKDPQRCWSFNLWKTRLLLNFKGLDYTTQWVEYPDIRPLLEKHLPGEEEYTLPTIHLLKDDTYIMDSLKIARHIEAIHPEPPLYLDSPLIDQLWQHLRGVLIAIQPIHIHLIATRLLSEKSTPYFFETREKDIGKSTAEWYREHEGTAWEKSTPHFSAITALLKETDGPFFMGGVVSYVDFIWAAVLLFFKTLGDDVFANVLKASGDDGESFKALLEAVQPWSARNDF
ncbi:unnamed protein product [Clonostachys byssicola]|uniref:GST N-terminal domain-containing protein n=1 Tax=Clonostachys byssicola TaxID=160290 RepID=A0A9N9XZ84_9HYPO|nr:unnamed protein product [Clonostachys byssicola]